MTQPGRLSWRKLNKPDVHCMPYYFALPQVLSFGLVHKRQVGLPTSTVQACLPYWLETAGWAAAVLSDAAAAAMGRLPATKSSRLPLSPIKSWVRRKPYAMPCANVN